MAYEHDDYAQGQDAAVYGEAGAEDGSWDEQDAGQEDWVAWGHANTVTRSHRHRHHHHRHHHHHHAADVDAQDKVDYADLYHDPKSRRHHHHHHHRGKRVMLGVVLFVAVAVAAFIACGFVLLW